MILRPRADGRAARPLAEAATSVGERSWPWRLPLRLIGNRRMLAAFLTVGSLTAVTRGVATLKEVAVARWFGRGDALDAFLIAFILPSFAASVVAGSVQAALVPTYTAVRATEGPAAAHGLFSALWLRTVLGLGAVTVVMAVAGRHLLPLIGSGFSRAKLDYTYVLYVGLLPMIVLAGTGTTFAAVLNAEERFARAASVGIITPLLTLASILAFGRRAGVATLVFGVVAGSAVEAGILRLQVRRSGIRFRPRWGGTHPRLGGVLRQYLPVAAGTVVLSASALVDQAMAAALAPGSVSALAYGTRIVAVLLGIGAVALSTSTLPRFSALAIHGEWTELRRASLRTGALVVAIAIPVATGIALLSRPLVGLLFQGGAFHASDTALVARIQAVFVFQLPFYAVGMVFVTLISAMRANQFLLWGSLLSLVANVALDWVLMRRFGVIGIAAATVLVQVITASFLSFVVLRLFARRAP